ncbi:hypothetical protein IOC57_24655 [Bacillus sp. SD075]|uniref:hypothetical protein n=1 Tax=Bacillus sp. SD075 TaxID=2781732 RepID=UPI001A95DC33|nr:hypothetical protein [Bacillus sp. SD075]MBO1000906.1 hypothetical protein [Bacillus sp. SD075]
MFTFKLSEVNSAHWYSLIFFECGVLRKYLAEKIETYLFIQLPKPSEYPNVLKISVGDYWCIQNNGWSIDSATEIFSEEWISDASFLSPNLKFMGIINSIIN